MTKDAELVHAAIRERYLPRVMAALREAEATMSPATRAVLARLPGGAAWDRLRDRRLGR